MNENFHRRLVWSVDPFAEDPQSLRSAALAARSWQSATQGEVIPAFVLGCQQIGLSYELEFDSPDAIAEEAQKRLDEALKRLRVRNLRPLETLVARSRTQAQDVSILRDFAWTNRAESILLATRGRSGLRRTLLGSFSETALLQSTIPLLTVNPGTLPSRRIQRILFPTGLGKDSRWAFAKTIPLAQELGARITLLHIVRGLERKDAIEKTLRAWALLSQNCGVETDPLLIRSRGSVSRAILRFARDKKADLIAIESMSGSVRSSFIGSVCRDIVRAAPCPVWSIRPALVTARKPPTAPPVYSILRPEALDGSQAA